MSMLRIVAGQGAATCQDILHLAMKLADAARELGLRVEMLRCSRSQGSASRYLWLVDHGARRWLVRISNHRMPIGTDHPVPHLDFVSLDGAEGLQQAMLFLHSVAMSLIAWTDPEDPARRAELKRLRRPRRRP